MKRKMQELKRLFHYTVGMHLEKIFRDKYLKLATACVMADEKGAVWMTYSQDWENTANKSRIELINGELVRIIQNKEETEATCDGLFRIEIKSDKYKNNDWRDFKKRSGIDSRFASALYRVAVSEGSRIGLWRCSFEPIPIDEWICLEKWDGKEWVKIELEDTLKSKDESDRVAA